MLLYGKKCNTVSAGLFFLWAKSIWIPFSEKKSISRASICNLPIRKYIYIYRRIGIVREEIAALFTG